MKYITPADVWQQIPLRGAGTNKSDYGKALIIAGCSEYRGAAALCTLGALRVGAGLVTLASGESVISSVASRILEATFLPLPCDKLLPYAKAASSVLIGCGMPEDEGSAAILRSVLPICSGCAIIDAGGLCSIKHELSLLKRAQSTPIITPHIGEMAKLCGKTTQEILSSGGEAALAFAMEYGVVVVLKCHRTLIAAPNGMLWQNTTGNAGLARGGSGDVLAGIIVGLAATGLSPIAAAYCGVYLHGLAADICAARLSMQGMLPEDILIDLCGIFRDNGR